MQFFLKCLNFFAAHTESTGINADVIDTDTAGILNEAYGSVENDGDLVCFF